MNVRRITRLIHLLQILQSGGGLNIDGLSRACSVSHRTMFRDIGSLRAAGVPVSYDSDRDGYTIPNSYFLPQINFTPDEAVSLVTLGIELGRETGTPFFEAARSAAHKLEQCLPPTHRGRIKRAAHAVQFAIATSDGRVACQATFTRLLEARMAGNVVQIEYDLASDGVMDEFRFQTYCLQLSGGIWYAIGKCLNDGIIRPLELSRLNFVRELDIQYNIPSKFNIERAVGGRGKSLDDTRLFQNVQIRFDASVAPEVVATEWHDSLIIENEDGTILFNVRTSDLKQMASWIVGFGSAAEVIEPTNLREMVVRLAEAVLLRYRVNGRTRGDRIGVDKHTLHNTATIARSGGSGTADTNVLISVP